MDIHCISDTHSKHERFRLPGGDILIHAGDCTGNGSEQHAHLFLEWFGKQPYTHKILVPGNHDFAFEDELQKLKRASKRKGITLLVDSGITINGINIWGSPITPVFYNWAFMRHRGDQIAQTWNKIPSDTEILITHGPPAGILDRTMKGDMAGCIDLLAKINTTQIKLHVFGHIHEDRGAKEIDGKIFINASAVSAFYLPVGGVPWKVVRTDKGQYCLI
jgi:Icc-related predicted phosphoesterase